MPTPQLLSCLRSVREPDHWVWVTPFVELTNGTSAVFYNTAGLVFLEKSGSTSFYSNQYSSSHYGSVGYARPNLGLSYRQLSSGDPTERDLYGKSTGNFSKNQNLNLPPCGRGFLLHRGTTRDLNDVYKLLANKPTFNREATRKCFQFSLCLNGDPRKVDSANLDEITNREIRQSLLPMLRKGESVDLAHMKSDVNPLVEDFLSFKDNEIEFFENLYEEKQYEPDVLFGNVEFNSKLKNHPGIEWRLLNI